MAGSIPHGTSYTVKLKNKYPTKVYVPHDLNYHRYTYQDFRYPGIQSRATFVVHPQ